MSRRHSTPGGGRPTLREVLKHEALRLRAASQFARRTAADLWRRLQPVVRRAGTRLRPAAVWLRRRTPSGRFLLVLAAALFVIGSVSWHRCGVAGCPDVEVLRAWQPGGASVLLDRNGERFADLAPMEYRVVSLDSLPAYVPAAFVAVEDRRFYGHHGVDWRRVLGAAWADLRAGRLAQGSSTITMQLSRSLFSDRIRREDRTLGRKLLEVRIAGALEDHFSKQEILELYLNHVYFGGGSYGIRAASRYWFGKDATKLDLEEAAMLAGLLRAPASYDPRRHTEAAKARRDLVLALMETQGKISPEAAASARKQGIDVTADPEPDRANRVAPWFVQRVRRQLEDELGESLYARPLRIHTTLDPVAQRAAQEELETSLRSVERGTFGRLVAPAPTDGAEGSDRLQGAVVVLDVQSGDVRAWIGGRDFDDSRYDRALLARRQTGSAFKPFVYGAALEADLSPSQPILDAPYRVATGGGEDWEPVNFSGEFEGLMSLREALVRSENVPAVRLAAAVGIDSVRDFARRAGITGDVPSSPVAALGVTDASPLEMAVAYASFATGGSRPVPRFVTRVEDSAGRVVMATEPERVPVTDPVTSFLLTDMLRDVVDRGTGAAVRSVGFHGPAAGKTGTTSDATDAWFVGYTPEMVGAVWVGFDATRPLPSRATGGGVAAPIWGRMMSRIQRGRSDTEWGSRPAGVVALQVDPETGLVMESGCRARSGEVRTELFRAGAEPATTCPRHERRGFLDVVGDFLGSVFGTNRPELRIPGQPDPDLGVPRLPTREAVGAKVSG